MINILSWNCQRRGGLALLWHGSLNVNIQTLSLNHIDVLVDNLCSGGWRFTGIYGHPEDEQKLKIVVKYNPPLWR